MRRGALLAMLCAVLAPGTAVAPVAAQERADKARLDEFALPPEPESPRIEQLGETGEALPAAPGTRDRVLAIPGPPPTARAPLPQLSRPGQGGAAPQLSGVEQSRQLAAGSVSSARDSRPEPAAALAGHDRCDPQLEGEQMAQCRRILELRAGEFSAAEPPKMSAEQALLAERGESLEALASTSPDLRLKLAGGSDPSAESRTNQELAAIFLDRSPPDQPAATVAPPEDTLAEGIPELLEGLGQIAPAGQGN